MSTSPSQLHRSEIQLVLIFQLLQHLSQCSTSFLEIFAIQQDKILATKELVQNLSAFQTTLLELNVEQTLTAELDFGAQLVLVLLLLPLEELVLTFLQLLHPLLNADLELSALTRNAFCLSQLLQVQTLDLPLLSLNHLLIEFVLLDMLIQPLRLHGSALQVQRQQLLLLPLLELARQPSLKLTDLQEQLEILINVVITLMLITIALGLQVILESQQFFQQ
jgi:hypothetical protein